MKQFFLFNKVKNFLILKLWFISKYYNFTNKKILNLYLPPDSGGWNYISSNWIETTDDLYVDEIDFQVRKNGSINITVDGFPRQGNRYLRRKILLSMPAIAMPFPLCHKEIAFKEAIKNNHFVFSTFRDPIESISSYISEFSNHTNQNKILNNINKFIFTKNDYIYIEKCFLFYIRMTDFIYNNIENIYVVSFDSIKNDENNSLSLKISNLVSNNIYIEPHQVEPHSSADKLMFQYLMSDKFILIRDKAYKSYNKVLDLKIIYPDRFI
jgi:hypothetical protein